MRRRATRATSFVPVVSDIFRRVNCQSLVSLAECARYDRLRATETDRVACTVRLLPGCGCRGLIPTAFSRGES